MALDPGRHVIGRARSHAAVPLDDPTVEPHHVLLEVDEAGSATVAQLCGRVPVTVDGQPVDGPTPLHDGAQVVLGATRLEIRLGAALGEPADLADPLARPAVASAGTFLRRPRTVVEAPNDPILLPDPPEHGTDPAGSGLPLLGAVVGGCGALVLSVVLRQPMFAVFGLLGVTVPLVTWIGGRVQARRRRRRADRSHEEAVACALDEAARRHAHRRAVLCRTAPSVAEALAALDGPHQWERRPAHGDAFTVTLGWGEIAVDPPVCSAPTTALARFADAPFRLDLDRPSGRGELLTILGPSDAAAGVVRGLVAQLAVFTGPADWRLVALAADPDLRRWARLLPHAHDPSVEDGAAVVDGADPVAVTRLLDGLDPMAGRRGPGHRSHPVAGPDAPDATASGDRRRIVVLTDRAELLTTRTGPLRRLLDRRPDTAVLLTVDHDAAVPAIATSVLRLGAAGRATWADHGDHGIATGPTPVAGLGDGAVDAVPAARPDDLPSLAADGARGVDRGSGDLDGGEGPVAWAQRLHVARLPIAATERLAARLAVHRDPEDPTAVTHPMPERVGLGDLVHLPQTAADLAARWEGDHTTGLPLVLGADGLGPVTLDLVADGPHALVAGTTGSGKSELLRSLVLGLALAHPPERCTFALVDFKGGAAFDACARLPHTVGLLTDLDGHEVGRVVAGLEAELRRRERGLREAGATDVSLVRSVPRLVVVVDEFAALAAEHPDALRAFLSIAQRGRSLGVHLVLATQRPAGVVDDAIRANTDLRIALRLSDRADSVDVLGDPVAATIPRRAPGRAALRSVGAVGGGPGIGVVGIGAATRLVQIAAVDGGEEGLGRLVDLAVAAHRAGGGGAPHRPWLPPLPDHLDPSDLEGTIADGDTAATGTSTSDAVGVVDDPTRQQRHSLRWDTTCGNLALIGGRRTGTTTALITLAAATPCGTHLYVLDARGDADLERLDLLPTCAGVIRAHETERLDRCLRVLAGRIIQPAAVASGDGTDQATRPGADRPEILLLVDGLGELRRSLDDPDRSEALGHLDRILADGPRLGIRTAAVLDPATATGAVLTRFAERWMFHLDDPADGPTFGVPARSVPPRRPGRLVVAGSGLTAQLAVAVPAAVDPGADRRPRRIEVLPTRLPMAELMIRTGHDPARSVLPDAARGRSRLVVGLRNEDLAVATLDLDAGAHLAVVGPAGSGRTEALRLLAGAWMVRYGNDTVEDLTGGVLPTGTTASGGGDAMGSTGSAAPRSRRSTSHSGVDAADRCADELMRLADRRDPVLVLLDEADRIDDPLGRIAAAVELLPPWVHLAVAIRSDVTHVRHGHWTAALRRSGRGLVAATGNPHDGDLLGVMVPRRVGLPWRPGLWWLVGRSGTDLIQAAIAEPWPSRSTVAAGMMGT